MKRFIPFLLMLAFASPACGEDQWQVSPDFAGKKARKEISGAACSPDFCIAVNDETNWVQTFRVRGTTLVPGTKVDLLDDGREIDAEAVAYTDRTFYITGSHGLSRKKAKFRPSQFLVFRLSNTGIERSDRLRDAIREMDVLGAFAETPLNENGANIEGLAVSGDRLYFGFRGPNVGGKGFILEVSAEALFGNGPLDAMTHAIALEEAVGIRDMATVTDGILLLTGPVDTLPRRYQVWQWSKTDKEPTLLADVPLPSKGKPEGLLVLGEGEQAYTVLIFHDGPRNGAPASLTITKR